MMLERKWLHEMVPGAWGGSRWHVLGTGAVYGLMELRASVDERYGDLS